MLLSITVPSTFPVPRSPRYESLDIWRGIACLMVVVCHSTFYLSASPMRWHGFFQGGVVFLLTRMWMGVPIFFVISGYCISATCDSSRRRSSPMSQYFQRRLKRIYPPYLLFTGVAVILFTLVAKAGFFYYLADSAIQQHGNAVGYGFDNSG